MKHQPAKVKFQELWGAIVCRRRRPVLDQILNAVERVLMVETNSTVG
jgi:hypothetical protein